MIRLYSEKKNFILVLWYRSRQEIQEDSIVPNFYILIDFSRHYSFQGFEYFSTFLLSFVQAMDKDYNPLKFFTKITVKGNCTAY